MRENLYCAAPEAGSNCFEKVRPDPKIQLVKRSLQDAQN